MLESLAGGLIIGLAVSLNLLLIGRIFGLSGMIYTSVTLNLRMGFAWKFSALTGMITAIYSILTYANLGFKLVDDYSDFISHLNIFGWILGGFLVGFGTKLGNGCTSGHGICGLARLSARSLTAVLCFMGSAVAFANIKAKT